MHSRRVARPVSDAYLDLAEAHGRKYITFVLRFVAISKWIELFDDTTSQFGFMWVPAKSIAGDICQSFSSSDVSPINFLHIYYLRCKRLNFIAYVIICDWRKKLFYYVRIDSQGIFLITVRNRVTKIIDYLLMVSCVSVRNLCEPRSSDFAVQGLQRAGVTWCKYCKIPRNVSLSKTVPICDFRFPLFTVFSLQCRFCYLRNACAPSRFFIQTEIIFLYFSR